MQIYKVTAISTFQSNIVCSSMVKSNDLWDGYMDQRKVRGLVLFCGQDGFRAQVPQHPIDTYDYHISNYIEKCIDFIQHVVSNGNF